MELFINPEPAFTKHVVARGLLHTPLVLVDVGMLGGVNPRWEHLGDYLTLHGFDASEAAIAELERARTPGRNYHWCAIGDADGEAAFYFNPANPSSSSFIPAGADRFAAATADYEKQSVRVRSIDSLVRSGELPAPDFLKIDVEGFELSVFRGAAQSIAASLLGLEFETSMNVGPDYPNTHFGTLQQLRLPEGFRLSDLASDRATSNLPRGPTPRGYGIAR